MDLTSDDVLKKIREIMDGLTGDLLCEMRKKMLMKKSMDVVFASTVLTRLQGVDAFLTFYKTNPECTKQKTIAQYNGIIKDIYTQYDYGVFDNNFKVPEEMGYFWNARCPNWFTHIMMVKLYRYHINYKVPVNRKAWDEI